MTPAEKEYCKNVYNIINNLCSVSFSYHCYTSMLYVNCQHTQVKSTRFTHTLSVRGGFILSTIQKVRSCFIFLRMA